ncbi:TetR/AcrR family transcriptional regulator [Anaerorhabdus sp.]|uniref:TetR/AcrR family transcriptional regulator n=1 Tax=Anaerorhabdus sp. TaxID=1872524 RepID=UPI002FC698B1
MNAKSKLQFSALKNFSEIGYYESTTLQISKDAGLSEATLFRTFDNKEDLYYSTLTYYSDTSNLNFYPLLSNLTFNDIQFDLTQITEFIVDTYISRIHMTRILISNLIQVKSIREHHSLVISEIHSFLMNYFVEMNIRNLICSLDYDTIANSIISCILYEITQETVFNKKVDFTKKDKEKIINKINSTLDVICLFLL